MAVLYITEYADLAQMPDQTRHEMPQEPALVDQTVAIGGASTASLAFGNSTRFVRLHSDAICSILFGTAPTATATKGRMAANQTEYRGVPQGASYKVAVITNT